MGERTTPDISAIRNRQDAKRRLLREKQSRETLLRADMRRIAAERKRLNKQLVATARAIQNSEAKLTGIEARQGELDAQETILRGSLEQRYSVIAKLLGALQRMGRNPPPVIVTKRKDALTMVRSAMLLASAFPELREKATALAVELEQLATVQTRARIEAEKLKIETARHNDTRIQLATLIEQKRRSHSERQAELVSLRREAVEIKRSVSSLGELITRLDKAVAARTMLGVFERQQSRQAALAVARQKAIAARPNSGVITPRSSVPTNLPKSSAPDTVLIAPKSNLAMVNPGRLQPAIPFTSARGRLPRPANGRQAVSFGEKTQYGARSKGIVIRTRHGAQITSPADGWIVYAGEFRSYGQLLIINVGQGYHIILAGLTQIDVQLGQFVLAGEPLGVMNSAIRGSKSKTQANAPVLYVEFRKKGRPINPRPWWAKNTQKVQG